MKCPGQDTQYWNAGAIFEASCPKCGVAVEFFKDDTTRKCGGCGHRFLNPRMDFGCASYCQFAEQCIGDLPPELLAQKEDLLKDRVAIEMKRHFATDFRRIGHATRAARHAEHIGRELGGNLAVIISAAYLLHVENAASPSGNGDAPVTREILQRLGARPLLIDTVCAIVGAYPFPDAAPDASADLLAVHDAERIAQWEDRIKVDPGIAEGLLARIDDVLYSAPGRREARSALNAC